jgi:hypothetical protein
MIGKALVVFVLLGFLGGCVARVTWDYQSEGTVAGELSGPAAEDGE